MTEKDIVVVQEVVTIADGKHIGSIANMLREERGNFDYTDIYINIIEDDKEITIKTGFPTTISTKSSFGIFLANAGIEFVPNQEISLKDIKKRLIGRTIEFQTFTDNNDFAKVINKTIVFVD